VDQRRWTGDWDGLLDQTFTAEVWDGLLKEENK
jgi:hypothetical protein